MLILKKKTAALLAERIRVKFGEGLLTEEEAAVFRRAFNSGHLQRPKHASGAEYRTATGFEAVLGLLYHTAQTERLHYLLEMAHGEDLCHADA